LATREKIADIRSDLADERIAGTALGFPQFRAVDGISRVDPNQTPACAFFLAVPARLGPWPLQCGGQAAPAVRHPTDSAGDAG